MFVPHFSVQPVRLAIWAPIAFGTGAILYFALDYEPPPGLPVIVIFLALALAVLALSACRARPLAWSVLMLAAMALLGLARAQLHTEGQGGHFVDESARARTVTGWIESVQSRRGRERLVLRVATLEDAATPPRRLRFHAQRGEFAPGDAVQARIVLAPPRRPAVPGGYDPAFAAWFSGLGGSGYAIAPLEAEDLPRPGAQRRLTRWRWRLAEHIRTRAHPGTAGIAAALLTGDRSGIETGQAEALRAAGLGHILAISGLHMSLFAGGLFFAVRAGLAAIPALARRQDPRIPAALIALAGAALYLVLSGLSVSTQRAFVMVAVILLGVVFRRRAISLQSIALAATLILVLQPQSILSPGFQMSFAAAAALVAAFDAWRRRQRSVARRGWATGLVKFWTSLSLSSLVAGSATAAFAAFHFNRIAVYGFLANLAAMPVFSLVVMPAGALALALAPLGLDAPALAVMSRGLVWVTGVAETVAGWPGALAPAAAAPGVVVALYALGFVLVVAATGAVRALGAGLMAIAWLAWGLSAPPDLFISEDGVVLVRHPGGEREAWASSDRRRARFATRVFLEQVGSQSAPSRAGWSCDARGCRAGTSGFTVVMTRNGESLAEDCARANLVILHERASPVQRYHCAAQLVDSADRARAGAHSLWLDETGVVRVRTVEGRRGRRPWTQRSDR